jgi:methionyl-tRNA formyltransferase
MKLALVGSRYFGATVFKALQPLPGVQIVAVVAPAADDRLALAATQAGVPLHVQSNPKLVGGEAVPEGVDLIVAAHTHARVSNEALAHARLGGVGYHPSLLPRHRGIAAVEWTILEGDPIAGGSVYHLADGWDAGAVAAQDWCFVGPGEDARSLWERALAPMGVKLLLQVVQHAQQHGALPAFEQDPRYATKAPLLRKPVVLQEATTNGPVQLVVTAMGRDRPGIVRQLAERAQRHGANWAGSHFSRLAGEFAGTVHLQVPAAAVPALTEALQDLETAGLNVLVVPSDATSSTPAGFRRLKLELVGDDRVGIVSQVTSMLAARAISIASLQTDVVGDSFNINAQLLVPNAVDAHGLQQELGTLAQALRLDITLGEDPHER